MGQVFGVLLGSRPRSLVGKLRRRLKGRTLTRAKCAKKYLQLALDHDTRAIANNEAVPVEKLIFGNDTKAVNAINKALLILTEALGSQVEFLPNQ